MRVWAVAGLWLAACGGKDADTGNTFVDNSNCRGAWASEPLGTIPADEWPDGLASAIPLLEELDGLWRAEECDDTDEVVDLKIVIPPQDELQVYRTPPTASGCGCDTDPSFATDDTYSPVARIDIDVFVEDFADYAMNEQNFTIPLIFFQDGNDLKARACQRVRVDPDLDDAWTHGTVIVRLEAGGVLSGAIELENASSTKSCALSQFTGR